MATSSGSTSCALTAHMSMPADRLRLLLVEDGCPTTPTFSRAASSREWGAGHFAPAPRRAAAGRVRVHGRRRASTSSSSTCRCPTRTGCTRWRAPGARPTCRIGSPVSTTSGSARSGAGRGAGLSRQGAHRRPPLVRCRATPSNATACSRSWSGPTRQDLLRRHHVARAAQHPLRDHLVLRSALDPRTEHMEAEKRGSSAWRTIAPSSRSH